MTTRKVTAIEEKVLALAVEWAEADAREDEHYAKHGVDIYTKTLWPLSKILRDNADRADERLRSAIVRLLKQRRAKGEKK